MNNGFRGFRVGPVECAGKFRADPGKDCDVVVLLKMDVADPAVFAREQAYRTTDVFIVAGLAKKVEHYLVELHKQIQFWGLGNPVETGCDVGKCLFLFRGRSDSTSSGHQSKQSTGQLDPQKPPFIPHLGNFDAFARKDFNQSFSGESLQCLTNRCTTDSNQLL